MVEKLVANPCGKHSKQRQDACSLIWHGWQVEKVKEHALRGWVDGGDGRLYHHVVAEKALEAWIESLLALYLAHKAMQNDGVLKLIHLSLKVSYAMQFTD